MPKIFPVGAVHGKCGGLFGGAKRDRTADLLHAMQALSQLSYGPIFRLSPEGYFGAGWDRAG